MRQIVELSMSMVAAAVVVTVVAIFVIGFLNCNGDPILFVQNTTHVLINVFRALTSTL